MYNKIKEIENLTNEIRKIENQFDDEEIFQEAEKHGFIRTEKSWIAMETLAYGIRITVGGGAKDTIHYIKNFYDNHEGEWTNNPFK